MKDSAYFAFFCYFNGGEEPWTPSDCPESLKVHQIHTLKQCKVDYKTLPMGQHFFVDIKDNTKLLWQTTWLKVQCCDEYKEDFYVVGVTPDFMTHFTLLMDINGLTKEFSLTENRYNKRLNQCYELKTTFTVEKTNCSKGIEFEFTLRSGSSLQTYIRDESEENEEGFVII